MVLASIDDKNGLLYISLILFLYLLAEQMMNSFKVNNTVLFA